MANEFIARNGLIAQNNSTVTGSLTVTGGITGSLLGTASTASFVQTAQTASYVLNAVSSSFATLAQTANTASFVTTAQTASFVAWANVNETTTDIFLGTASYASQALSSSFSTTASYALNSLSASFATTASLILNPLLLTNRQTNSYTLVLSDAGKIVEMNSGSVITLTVPTSSVTNFTIGTQIMVTQYGLGQLSIITGSSNVFVRSAGYRYKLTSQYSGATLVKIDSDEWYLFGDLSV